MKTTAIYRNRFWLVAGIVLVYFGMQLSCTPEHPFDRITKVTFNIPLPESNNLKSAASVAGVTGVTLRVSAGDEILAEEELTISGNTASGTVTLSPDENITFTVEATDENDIIQWQGSTTMDVVEDFSVDINLTPIRPAASSLQASETENSVNLSWTQNSDNDFERYDLLRSQSANESGSNVFSTTAIDETAFRDTLIAEGQSYFYTLVVVDTEGFNTNSNSVRADMPVINPEPVSLQLISNDSNRVRLSWSQNTDIDFAGYELQRSLSADETGESVFSTSVVTQTTFEDTEVEEETSYFYTCVVTDTAGFTASSNVVQVDMPLIGPTPSILKGAFDEVVYLSWTQNSDSDFAGYELFRSESEDELGQSIFSSLVVSTTEFTDEDVSAGVTYFYTLVVSDLDQLSAKSNVVQIEVPRFPPSPVILSEESGDYPYLFWTQNMDSDFARYDVYRSLSGSEPWDSLYSTTNISETDYTDENVTAGNTYHYKVIVFDTEGLSAESNVVQVAVSRTPPEPVILSEESGDYPYLYWTQNTDSDFARYAVYRSLSGDDPWGRVYSTSSISDTYFIDDNAPAGNTYYYKVVVFDTEGLSAESNVVQIEIHGTPPTPVYLEGYDEIEYVYLYWEENTDDDFERYDLYRSELSNTWGEILFTATEVSNTDFLDEAATEGVTYYYRVIVYDTEKLNAESNVVELTVENYNYPNPSELTGEYQVVDEVMMIQLTWTENYDSDFDRYELHRSESPGVLGPSIFSTQEISSTYFEDTDINFNSTYYYTLVVYDIGGLSTNSNVEQISTPYIIGKKK